MKKTILIFGGTGFIGRHLTQELKDDYGLVVFTRKPLKTTRNTGNVNFETYQTDDPASLLPFFEKASGVINLAGQNIGEKRWTESFKNEIMESRLKTGTFIRSAFEKSKNKPAFFIQGSASGYYGINPSDAEITEGRPSTRDSFLTKVAVNAEENVADLSKMTRLIFIRTGIVLDKEEGALPQMALPFKLFAGGPLGSGKQWFPWIHIRDEVRAIQFVVENKDIDGPVNLTAPRPVRQEELAKKLGKVLNRPWFMPAPAFALRLVLGKERANDLLLSGLKVVPDKLQKSGFEFQFNTLDSALNEIYK